MKAFWLYDSPIGDDFNTIALFAAAEKSDLSAVRGASLTGKLTRKVSVAFNVERDRPTGMYGVKGVDHVVMTLDKLEPGRGRIHKGVVYS